VGSGRPAAEDGSAVASELSRDGDMLAAMQAAMHGLSSERTSKQRVVVRGSGNVPTSSRLSLPSYTVLDVCGTINVTGSGSGDMALGVPAAPPMSRCRTCGCPAGSASASTTTATTARSRCATVIASGGGRGIFCLSESGGRARSEFPDLPRDHLPEPDRHQHRIVQSPCGGANNVIRNVTRVNLSLSWC